MKKHNTNKAKHDQCCHKCLQPIFAGDYCYEEWRHIGTIPSEMGGGKREKLLMWHPGCAGKKKKEAEKP